MRVLPVPDELKNPPWPYPRHNHGAGVEDTCSRFLLEHAAEIRSDRVYLPIHWMNNYFWQAHRDNVIDYFPLARAQRFIEALDPNERYVTVCQCSDGIYERFPDGVDVTVLGASGIGDVPLPLVTAAHPAPATGSDRSLLASFMGNIDCGSSQFPPGTATRSSWDPDGPGAQVRREMVRAFAGHDGCRVEQGRARNGGDIQAFRDLMYRSKYALAPRGYGRTSFRLYEAMQMGCVPVYIYDDPWLPYEDLLDWEVFCVLCPREEMPSLPDRLRGLSEDWRSDAIGQLRWLVPDYFSLEGLTKQLPRIIEGLDA